MSKALVVSGGGSKGAFAAGVLRQLVDAIPNLHFDIFVGTSTGALIVPMAALEQYELLEQLYTTTKTSDVILHKRIGDAIAENSLYDASPLGNLIKKYYSDPNVEPLLNGTKKLFINTVCLQTGELVVFTNSTDVKTSSHYRLIKLQDALHFRRAVMASTCQPVFMPPIQVNIDAPEEANQHYQYVDGGIREYVGVQIAIDQGATEIIAILLSPGMPSNPTGLLTTMLPILAQTVDILTMDVGKNDLIIPQQYNQALQYLDAVKNKMIADGVPPEKLADFFSVPAANPFQDKIPLKIYTIRPSNELGGGPGGLEFNPSEMSVMVSKGRQVANAFVAALPADDPIWV